MSRRPRGGLRVLTAAAALLLGADGAALVALGAWSGRWMLVAFGAALLVAAGITALSWRWQERRMQAIADERRALAREMRELNDFIHRR